LARNDRPCAVVDLPIILILCESKMDHRAEVVTRLRLSAADDPGHLSSDGIRRTFAILIRVLEERRYVPERREADAKHICVLRSEYNLIEQLRIEAVLDADLAGIRRARKRIRGVAFGPRPIA